LDVGIERATGIVWNITGGKDMTLFEVRSLTLHFFFPSGICTTQRAAMLIAIKSVR
jgi:hypothetical protein